MVIEYDTFLVGKPSDLIDYIVKQLNDNTDLYDYVGEYNGLMQELGLYHQDKVLELYDNPMSASPMISDRVVVLSGFEGYDMGIAREDDYETELGADEYVVFNYEHNVNIGDNVVVYVNYVSSGVLNDYNILEGSVIGFNRNNDPIVEVW